VEDLEAEKEDVAAENERRQVQTIVKVAMNAFSIYFCKSSISHTDIQPHMICFFYCF
jgi:hypothetical protein